MKLMKAVPRLSRRTKWITVLAMLVIAVVAWPYASVIVAVKYFAAETYPRGIPRTDRYGGVESLSEHAKNILSMIPPSRMAWLLPKSSARSRALICNALAVNGVNQSAGQWNGLPTKLSQLAFTDPQPYVRTSAFMALRHAPEFSERDALAIQALVEAQPAGAARREALAVLAGKSPRTRPQLHTLLMKHARSDRVADRAEALILLIRYFPDQDELASVLRSVLPPPSGYELTDEVAALACKQPALLVELLKGADESATLALRALRSILESPTAHAALTKQLADLENSRSDGDRDSHRDARPDLFAVAEDRAAGFLTGDVRAAFDAAWLFLVKRPRGPVLFAESIPAASPEFRLPILLVLEYTTAAAMRASDGRFRYSKSQADHLVHMLLDPNAEVRAAVHRILACGLFADYRDGNPIVEGTGPRYRGNEDIFRHLLITPRLEHDDLALAFFTHVAPFELGDLDAVDAAIRRRGNSVHAQDALVQLFKRFPDQEQTRKLAKDILADDQANLRNVSSAGRFLFEHDPHPEAVFARLVEVYQQNRSDSFDLIRAIIGMAASAGGFTDPKLACDIWQDCVCARGKSEHESAIAHARSLVSAEQANDGVRVVVEYSLRTGDVPSFRHSQPIFKDMANAADLAAMFSSDPADRAFTATVAEALLSDDDPTTRARAVAFLADIHRQNSRRIEVLSNALDDPALGVQSVALRIVRRLRVTDTALMRKVRELVESFSDIGLRLSAMRTLEMLHANDPATKSVIADASRDAHPFVRSAAQGILKRLNAVTR